MAVPLDRRIRKLQAAPGYGERWQIALSGFVAQCETAGKADSVERLESLRHQSQGQSGIPISSVGGKGRC